MKSSSSNSSENLFQYFFSQRKCSSVEAFETFLSSPTPLPLLFLLLDLLLDQIGCAFNPSLQTKVRISQCFKSENVFQETQHYLCSLDSDKPVPSSWCIHSLLADLNLQKEHHHMKSKFIIVHKLVKNSSKMQKKSQYRCARVLLDLHNVSSTWPKHRSDQFFFNL